MRNPVIEIDLAGQITIGVMKVMFKRNDSAARKVTQDWIQATITSNLRSPKLANDVLRLTNNYADGSPRRVLGLRLAAFCGK